MGSIRKSSDIEALGRKADKTDWDNNFQVVIDMLVMLAGKIDVSKIGANSGVASLNSVGKVIQTALNSEKLDGKTFSQVAALFVAASLLGANNGVAELDSSGKLKTAQIPDGVGSSLTYKGGWNATTNSPTIPSAAGGNKNWFYIVTTAGTTTVSGISSWAVGDWIISNGSAWEKVPSTQAVLSVAGKTGTVTLSISDISGLVAALADKADTSSVTASLATKQDKHADAEYVPNTDLLAINQSGMYFVNDLGEMTNLPPDLVGLSSEAWIRIVIYEERKKIWIDAASHGAYSVGLSTSETTTDSWSLVGDIIEGV
jgi:hypothetical protein